MSLFIRPGEIFGLLGPNGAGKTTTIRILTTLLPPDSGTAYRRFGADLRPSAMAVRRLLGYVPQQLSADAALTGWENMGYSPGCTTCRERAQGPHRGSAGHDGTEGIRRPSRSTYSGGMVRRLELAQALVNRPRLLILDEPTVGLDPMARSGVWERVTLLREQMGMTVLLTTHYMEEADLLCDRVAMMHRGKVRAAGTPDELKADLAPGATLEDVFRHYAGDDWTTAKGVSAMSALPAAPLAGSADLRPPATGLADPVRRIVALCLVELRRSGTIAPSSTRVPFSRHCGC